MNGNGINFVRVDANGQPLRPYGYNHIPPNPKKKANPFIVTAWIALLSVISAIILSAFLFVDFSHTYVSSAEPSPVSVSDWLLGELAISEADAFPDDIPPVPAYFDFGAPVPEKEAVDLDYFKRTVFICDSRTVGLIMYTDIAPINFSAESANVQTIKTKSFIRLPNEKGVLTSYTLYEALEMKKGEYDAVYITLGLNELGWPVDRFIGEYRALVNDIRAIVDVPIYAQLIIPVTTESSKTTKYGITNEHGIVFNEQLRMLFSELSLFCLDPTAIFALEDGSLDPKYAADGVHLQKFACRMLVDYYASHTVDIADFDNTKQYIDSLDAINEASTASPEA